MNYDLASGALELRNSMKHRAVTAVSCKADFLLGVLFLDFHGTWHSLGKITSQLSPNHSGSWGELLSVMMSTHQYNFFLIFYTYYGLLGIALLLMTSIKNRVWICWPQDYHMHSLFLIWEGTMSSIRRRTAVMRVLWITCSDSHSFNFWDEPSELHTDGARGLQKTYADASPPGAELWTRSPTGLPARWHGHR